MTDQHPADHSTDPLLITPLSVAIHRQSENPVFGKDGSRGAGILHVSVDDDGGGKFLVIKQLEDDPEPGVIRANIEELPALIRAAQYLVRDDLIAAFERCEAEVMKESKQLKH